MTPDDGRPPDDDRISGTGRISGRPPDGQSRLRHVRIPDSTWIPAASKAQANGSSISAVTRKLLDAYVRGDITL